MIEAHEARKRKRININLSKQLGILCEKQTEKLFSIIISANRHIVRRTVSKYIFIR